MSQNPPVKNQVKKEVKTVESAPDMAALQTSTALPADPLVAQVLMLQRTAGNQSLVRYLNQGGSSNRGSSILPPTVRRKPPEEKQSEQNDPAQGTEMPAEEQIALAEPEPQQQLGAGDATPPDSKPEAAQQAAGAPKAGVETAQAGEKANTPAEKSEKSNAPGAAGAAAGEKKNQAAAPDAGQAAKPAPKRESVGEAGGQVEKAPASPQADAGFQAMIGEVKAAGSEEKVHASGAAKATQSSAAAVMPGAEKLALADATQTEKMGATPTPGFDPVEFRAKLKERISQVSPGTLEEAKQFDSGKLNGVKEQLKSETAEQRDETKKPLETATKETPDTGKVAEKKVEPLTPEPPGSTPNLQVTGRAAPKAKATGEVEQPMQAQAMQIDQMKENANITDEQLLKSNEPSMMQAVQEESKAKENAASAPAAFRQKEQAAIGQAQAEMTSSASTQAAAMHQERTAVFAQVSQSQVVTKTDDEKERARIGADIQAIYDETKKNVETTLSELDQQVASAFDQGANAAKQAFEDYVKAEMDAYFEKRYEGSAGWLRWLHDKVFSPPAEVNAFYAKGRQVFIAKMEGVLDSIVGIVGSGLAKAKAHIAEGRQKISAYIAQQPENLRDIAQKAAAGMEDKFAGLEQTVDAKQDELIDTLVSKYQEKLGEIDARIQEMKAANAGLFDRAVSALQEVIQTITQLKDMLSGVLAKAAGVIDKILKDPIAFLGNLITGIGQGFQNFAANILTHLQTGLVGWLTGALGEMSITIPDNLFSLEGIFSLAMQVMGISYEYIRSKAVKLFGEEVVQALEAGAGILNILKEKGLAGLWEYIKEQFNDLKEMVIDAIKEMVIGEVIEAGIKWIASLLTPAGALIKAAMTIYDVVTNLIQNASRYLAIADAILDSIIAIANGNLGGVAAMVENTLAKAVPVVINFLASALGLNDLAKKVQKIITKIRGKVDKAIDGLISRIRKTVGKLFGKGKKQPGEAEGQAGEEEEQPGEFIYEEPAKAGHTYKLTPDLEVFMFSETPKRVSSSKELKVRRDALKKACAGLYHEVKYPPDSLGRAAGPSGLVQGVKSGEKRGSMTARDKMNGYQENDDRGHLIGDRFWGAGIATNLVPMNSSLNRGEYETTEDSVAKAAKKFEEQGIPSLIYMKVTPHYPHDKDTWKAAYRPKSIEFHAEVITLKTGGKALSIDKQEFKGNFTNTRSGKYEKRDVLVKEEE